MNRFFIAIYRFFKDHKSLMWAILVVTTLLFGFLATRIEFEENLIQLFPSTDKIREAELAFSNMKVKDKVFVEFQAREGYTVSPEQLAEASDAYIDSLKALPRPCIRQVCYDQTGNTLQLP